jgi:hypothetical protein
MHHGAAIPVPETAVKARLVRAPGGDPMRGEPPSAATWEDVEDFVQRYPTFQPADELFV